MAWLKIDREHAGGGPCPVRAAAYCTHCSCYGHIATECTDSSVMVDFPETLEELIPEESRKRWGIVTRTPIRSVVTGGGKPDLETVHAAIADINTIDISHSTEVGSGRSLDKQLRAFMKANRIVHDNGCTNASQEKNLMELRRWAVERGKKVRIQVEQIS